jgi:hypothetical protein
VRQPSHRSGEKFQICLASITRFNPSGHCRNPGVTRLSYPEALLATIPAIYQAGLGKTEWADVLDRVARLLGSSVAALGIRSGNTRLAIASKKWSAVAAEVKNVCLEPLTYGRGVTLLGEPNVRSRLGAEASRRRPIAGERMEIVQALLFHEADCTGVFAAARPSDEGCFKSTHIRSFGVLWQHLGQALRIQVRLALANDRNCYLSGALDRIGQGVIVSKSYNEGHNRRPGSGSSGPRVPWWMRASRAPGTDQTSFWHGDAGE